MMERYGELVIHSFTGHGSYLVREVLNPSWGNYVYWLLGISLFFWLLEVVRPWRQHQAPWCTGRWNTSRWP